MEKPLARCSSAIVFVIVIVIVIVIVAVVVIVIANANDEKVAAKVTTSRNGSLALLGLAVVVESVSAAGRDSVGTAEVGRNVGSGTDQERGR